MRRAISTLPPEQITADLNAVVEHVAKLPACNGKVAVAGFCWGGSQTFRFATNNSAIKAAFVFYGSGPENAADLARIACPVYGFYGGNDARVNSTVPKSVELMKQAGKKYEPLTYDGRGTASSAPARQRTQRKPISKPERRPGSVCAACSRRSNRLAKGLDDTAKCFVVAFAAKTSVACNL